MKKIFILTLLCLAAISNISYASPINYNQTQSIKQSDIVLKSGWAHFRDRLFGYDYYHHRRRHHHPAPPPSPPHHHRPPHRW